MKKIIKENQCSEDRSVQLEKYSSEMFCYSGQVDKLGSRTKRQVKYDISGFKITAAIGLDFVARVEHLLVQIKTT